MTATDPRTEAIEAGARAMFEQAMPRAIKPWERQEPGFQRAFLDETERIYDAMAEIIQRAAVAANDREWCANLDLAGVRPDGMEFTPAVLAAIRQTERTKVAEEIAEAIEAKHVSVRLHKTCLPCEVGSAAASIARALAVPVSVVPADSAGGGS